MPEEDDISKPAVIGGIVPHFYYDLIGRIVPGGYLLITGYWLVHLQGETPTLQRSVSATAMLIAGLAAYAISFVIGSCSHWLFDRSRRFDKKDLAAITAVLTKNGIPLPTPDQKGRVHDSLVETSEFCSYILWQRAPQLAIICGRWDAEAFAARQFGTASIILFGLTAWMRCSGHSSKNDILALVLFTMIAVLSLFQFRYSRRKAILARFTMLACTDHGDSAQRAAAG